LELNEKKKGLNNIYVTRLRCDLRSKEFTYCQLVRTNPT